MPRFRFSVAGLFLWVTFCALALGFFVPTVRLAIRPDLRVESLAMSADGSRVAAIASDGAVLVWEADTGKEVADFAVTAPIGGIAALSADGRVLAVRPGWTDRIPPGPVAIQLWDVEERRALAPSAPTMGDALALAPRELLAAVCDVSSIKLLRWDEPGQPPSEHAFGENLSGPALAFSPDGRLLACCSHDWSEHEDARPGAMRGDPLPSPVKVKLIDCKHGQTMTEFDGPAGTFAHTSLSFSPEGRQLAVCVGFDFGYGDGRTRKSLEIREVETGRLTASLEEANSGWWRPSVAFLPDGQSVVVAGDDLLIWDFKMQKRLSTTGAAFDSIRLVASGCKGNLFATGGHSVTIWDTTKRKPLRTIWGSRVAGPSWLLLPGFAGWLVGWMALRSRKVRLR